MITFFSSIVTSCKDIAGKLRRISASAGGRIIDDRLLMQQRGFASVPKSGDQVLFLQLGNLIVAIASDCADRPPLAEGDAALYASASCYITVSPNGSIKIKAPKGVDVDGDLRVNGDVSDSVGKLSALRDKYNFHASIGNLGAPTGIPMPEFQDKGGT